jgi:formylglycine-generating enzyme required for sulfatase activity/predicted Ser/Thr protein kinase
MGRPSSERDDDSDTVESSIHDDAVDEVVRAIAHAPPRPPPPKPENGTRWGERDRYVINGLLGRGGMGTVYLAADTLLGRQVALKVLDAGEEPQDDAHRLRVLREARLAARLEHERVARVYDVGEHQDSIFVSMEYVRGPTLRDWMREPHTAEEILTVITQIADGLRVLHAAGVVHRDLKPENVMLPAEGGVKLVDFGLARHVGPLERGGPESSTAPTEVRTTSALHGTPGYMAPEQCAGERADARADVFALGVIGCELVTGERPFHGATLAALRGAVREHTPRFEGAAWERFPPQFAAVVARMLAFEREARFADGAEVLRAFEAPQEPKRALATMPIEGRWRSWRPWFVGGAVCMAVGAGGVIAAPRIAADRAYRKALALPPPPGMALINVGTITVGRTKEEVDAQCAQLGPKCDRAQLATQLPARRVTVPAFYLDLYEVTNMEMVAVLNTLRANFYVVRDEDDHSLRFLRFNSGIGHDGELLLDLFPTKGGIAYTPETSYPQETYFTREGRGRWPVAQASWFAANLYCRTLGKRLPSNVEWEAAARGASNRPFPWGDAPVRCGEVAVPADGMVPTDPGCEARRKTAQDVGTAPQDVTPEGIHDLGGNVTEWVDGVFGDAPVEPSASPLDVPRTVRGGSYAKSFMARTSAQMRQLPNNVAPNGGFRCASNLVK